jgi:hypothetical protein
MPSLENKDNYIIEINKESNKVLLYDDNGLDEKNVLIESFYGDNHDSMHLINENTNGRKFAFVDCDLKTVLFV